MEKYFGVSYPTIKNRLNQIGGQLSFVEIEQGSGTDAPVTAQAGEAGGSVLPSAERRERHAGQD